VVVAVPGGGGGGQDQDAGGDREQDPSGAHGEFLGRSSGRGTARAMDPRSARLGRSSAER
jgi:hypothetical protein